MRSYPSSEKDLVPEVYSVSVNFIQTYAIAQIANIHTSSVHKSIRNDIPCLKEEDSS